MSQEVISQKVKQTCEGCGKEYEFELVGPSEATLREMQNWYTVSRNVIVDERPVKLMAQACTLACVPAAAVKLALPPAPDPTPEIDLASLRLGNERPN